MATLTLTSKGQVTLKKDMLRHLDSKPGDQLDVTPQPDGSLVMKAARSGSIEDVFGLLQGKSRKVASVEEISALSARGWTGKRR